MQMLMSIVIEIIIYIHGHRRYRQDRQEIRITDQKRSTS